MVRWGIMNDNEKFNYPDIVHIKSYSYLEERRSAQLAEAMSVRIYGLTIIMIGPIAVQIVDLVERTFRRRN
jgi:acetaldehyde dehydrogenase (acetylating)